MTDEIENTDTVVGQVIGHAGAIIERFGGIRPMSAKTGIPVTTIQGWKKRDAIPVNRLREIKNAALMERIDIADLLSSKEAGVSARNIFGTSPETTPAGNRFALVGAGIALTIAVIIGGIIALSPQVRKITEQERRIAELEQELVEVKKIQNERKVSFELPSDIQRKLDGLQGKVNDLTEQARYYAAAVEDLKSGTMMERVNKLERHVGKLLQDANAQGLQNMLGRIQSLQNSPEGQAALESVVGKLAGAAIPEGEVNEKGAQEDRISIAFDKLRQSDPKIAETFKDVAPEDMRAAVMLVGMAQLRSSLARNNESFDQDLQILKMTAAKEDPKLQEAIDRLAPKAKSGILTPAGLSQQLRGLTGEIVAASLTGEDVSIEDKALARLGDIVKVEKEGELVSGNITQRQIAQAQKKLDEGDVEGAMVILNGLKGPAAEKAAPFMDEAKATLLAGRVENLLGQDLLLTLKGMTQKQAAYTNGGGGVEQLLGPLKDVVPVLPAYKSPSAGNRVIPEFSLPQSGE